MANPGDRHAILSHPAVMRYWPKPEHATLEEARVWLAGMVAGDRRCAALPCGPGRLSSRLSCCCGPVLTGTELSPFTTVRPDRSAA